MDEFRWIKITLFVILLLQFTAGQTQTSVTVRAGDEVTLSCGNVIKNQDKCNSTTWIFCRNNRQPSEELINLGQISNSEFPKTKTNRLNMTAKCSLVIRNVTREDVGRYTCRQFRSGQQQGQDASVLLSVVNMTRDDVNDKVTLFCTVFTYEQCEHTVKWLYEGNQTDVERIQGSCSARVTFPTHHLNQKSNYFELLKCNVTDKKSGKMLLCFTGLQSSCEKTGGSTSVGKNDTSSATNVTPRKHGWVVYMLVAVGVATLLAVVIVVVVIRRKRTKGNQTQMNENIGLSFNTAATPETNQDTADPEDGVSYASVSYTKKSNSTAQVLGKGGDEGDAVTYSSVKASSSSSAAGASADLSNLYATVNKPNK